MTRPARVAVRGAMVDVVLFALLQLNARPTFADAQIAPVRADHVDIVFNAGHAGVAEPRYHVIVRYVSPERAAQLAK